MVFESRLPLIVYVQDAVGAGVLIKWIVPQNFDLSGSELIHAVALFRYSTLSLSSRMNEWDPANHKVTLTECSGYACGLASHPVG